MCNFCHASGSSFCKLFLQFTWGFITDGDTDEDKSDHGDDDEPKAAVQKGLPRKRVKGNFFFL